MRRAGNPERNRPLFGRCSSDRCGPGFPHGAECYVMCWPCEDGRNKNVKLTPKAEDIDKDMKKNMQANEQKLLEPLSPEESEKLRDLLLKVVQHLV